MTLLTEKKALAGPKSLKALKKEAAKAVAGKLRRGRPKSGQWSTAAQTYKAYLDDGMSHDEAVKTIAGELGVHPNVFEAKLKLQGINGGTNIQKATPKPRQKRLSPEEAQRLYVNSQKTYKKLEGGKDTKFHSNKTMVPRLRMIPNPKLIQNHMALGSNAYDDNTYPFSIAFPAFAPQKLDRVFRMVPDLSHKFLQHLDNTQINQVIGQLVKGIDVHSKPHNPRVYVLDPRDLMDPNHKDLTNRLISALKHDGWEFDVQGNFHLFGYTKADISDVKMKLKGAASLKESYLYEQLVEPEFIYIIEWVDPRFVDDSRIVSLFEVRERRMAALRTKRRA